MTSTSPTPAFSCRRSRERARPFGSRSSRTSCPAGSLRPNTRSTTCGRRIVDLRDLVGSLLSRDTLRARQWVADAERALFDWSRVAEPHGLDGLGLAVAASVVEMMAERRGLPSPAWTSAVRPAPQRVFLVKAAESLPRLR